MSRPQKYHDVIKFLRSQGWVLLRQGKGSHEIWGVPGSSDPDDKHSIPHHAEVSAGVVSDLAKKLPKAPRSWR